APPGESMEFYRDEKRTTYRDKSKILFEVVGQIVSRDRLTRSLVELVLVAGPLDPAQARVGPSLRAYEPFLLRRVGPQQIGHHLHQHINRLSLVQKIRLRHRHSFLWSVYLKSVALLSCSSPDRNYSLRPAS